MIFAIILFFISLFLELLIPNLIKNFVPFFILTSIIITTLLVEEEKKCYILLFIYGIIYDLISADTLLLNAFLFITLGFITRKLINNGINFIKAFFIYIMEVLLYIVFMMFFTILYSSNNYIMFFSNIISSILTNICYFTLSYACFIGIKCLVSNTKKNSTYF